MAGKQVKAEVDLVVLQEENLQLKAQLQELQPKAVVDPNQYLPEAVRKQFELVNWVGGHLQNFGKFGDIDLTQMTAVKAQSLIRRKFSKIKAKS